MASIATGAIDLTKPDKFAPASKFMALIEYDPQGSTMDITFKSGSKHRYFRVFPTTFLSFKQSPTHDSYYARAIKGNLMSVKLVDAGIGKKTSTPLKHNHDERSGINAGLKKRQAAVKRINGSLNRIYATV